MSYELDRLMRHYGVTEASTSAPVRPTMPSAPQSTGAPGMTVTGDEAWMQNLSPLVRQQIKDTIAAQGGGETPTDNIGQSNANYEQNLLAYGQALEQYNQDLPAYQSYLNEYGDRLGEVSQYGSGWQGQMLTPGGYTQNIYRPANFNWSGTTPQGQVQAPSGTPGGNNPGTGSPGTVTPYPSVPVQTQPPSVYAPKPMPIYPSTPAQPELTDRQRAVQAALAAMSPADRAAAIARAQGSTTPAPSTPQQPASELTLRQAAVQAALANMNPTERAEAIARAQGSTAQFGGTSTGSLRAYAQGGRVYADGGTVEELADAYGVGPRGDLEAMLAQYMGPQVDYAAQLAEARASAKRERDAFDQMIQAQTQAPQSQSEMYLRLAAALGSPTRTGTLGETIGNAAGAIADAKAAERAAQSERTGLGLKGQQLRVESAGDELKSLTDQAREDERTKRALIASMLKDGADEGPALVQEYNFAKQGGYEGSFTDFMRLKKEGGAAAAYFTSIPTAQGVYAFDNRTGQMALVPGSGAAPVLTPSTDPNLKQTMESAGAFGRETGEAKAQANIRLPTKLAGAEQSLQLIDDLLTDPGFPTLYGKSGALGIAQAIPGSDAANARARLDQIGGKAFLEAFEALKGAGAITEKEGGQAKIAVSRLFDTNQSDESAVQAANELKATLVKGMDKARQLAGQGAPAASGSKRKRFNPETGLIEEY